MAYAPTTQTFQDGEQRHSPFRHASSCLRRVAERVAAKVWASLQGHCQACRAESAWGLFLAVPSTLIRAVMQTYDRLFASSRLKQVAWYCTCVRVSTRAIVRSPSCTARDHNSQTGLTLGVKLILGRDGRAWFAASRLPAVHVRPWTWVFEYWHLGLTALSG